MSLDTNLPAAKNMQEERQKELEALSAEARQFIQYVSGKDKKKAREYLSGMEEEKKTSVKLEVFMTRFYGWTLRASTMGS